MFDKSQRSSFPYWFAHWCAYQMTALNLGVWKWKYLLHDWEKPWLRLIWKYPKVKQWHRHHRKHHLEWLSIHSNKENELDWEALVIDWECSRFTKLASPLTAREKALKFLNHGYSSNVINNYIIPVCDRLGI